MNKVNILFFLILLFIPLIFFKTLLIQGQLPIPSDTITGLYYPFRDAYFKTNPNGLPYKNFLVTDPVRQQIPWKNLVIAAEKQISLPIWNPYNFAGAPLLANFQSGVFYPLNLLFFVLPFSSAWSLLIFSQPLLAGMFLFVYLRNLSLRKSASLFGAISFAFCGFSIAWMEWGTIISTALWLPLILLAIDKIMIQDLRSKTQEIRIKIFWSGIFVLALAFSFFAGHLQTFFYLSIIALAYFLVRLLQFGKRLQNLSLFLGLTILFLLLTIVQWLPTLNFLLLSARNVDLPGFTQAGWFIPWQNLIQFISPDFFGNPATLNYYGVWNYGEFIGYVGIVPLLMAFYALFFRRDRNVLFFGAAFFLSLIFALPTIFAKIPFNINIPFLSTAQPTRLLFITDFSLTVLSAFGLDYFINTKNKKWMLTIMGCVGLILAALWAFVLFLHGNILLAGNLEVAKQNLILPTAIFVVSCVALSIIILSRHKKITISVVYLLILIAAIDLFRFGWKFEPFTNKDYFFPSTSVTNFLQNQKGTFRVMSTDSKILPPNFSVMYKLQTVEGYDPLYLQRYGELMIAVSRGKPDITPPFGFNRIITPHEIPSQVINLLGVKYVLSLDKIINLQFKEVFTDGTTKVYENNVAFPRAFFVTETSIAGSKEQAINSLFYLSKSLSRTAIVEGVQNDNLFKATWNLGDAKITNYQNDKVVIQTNNQGEGFLVLTDSFYPTWHATVDGKETPIYLTDYNFRGIIVPKGMHTVVFYATIF